MDEQQIAEIEARAKKYMNGGTNADAHFSACKVPNLTRAWREQHELIRRFNRALSKWACGSEFHNDPELIAERIQLAMDFRVTFADKKARREQQAEIERLRERFDNQVEYGIKLQQLIESLKREDTPHPELHHHGMILAAKTELKALRELTEKAATVLAELDANDHPEPCEESRDRCVDCGWEFDEHPVHLEGRVCQEFQMRPCTCGIKALVTDLQSSSDLAAILAKPRAERTPSEQGIADAYELGQAVREGQVKA